MIISRDECKRLAAYLHNVQYVIDDVPENVAGIIDRIKSAAEAPDVLPPNTYRDAAGIVRADDGKIRAGSRVWQSNNPGAKVADLFRNDKFICGTVKVASMHRAYVEWDESDAIPVENYACWVKLEFLTKGEPPK